MHVRRIATAVDYRATFGERVFLVELVVTVEIGYVSGHHHALGVVPRADPDAIARMHGRTALAGHGAEIGAPRAIARAGGLGELMTVTIRAFQATQRGTVPRTDAGDKEAHPRGLL
ncbi:MAG: hypothetical protein A2Z17_03965 [Gammaproteobacteria bacterium RBG_16_66_13]|nr:MAG: hypothetical protein A2Z17_03965 [Gammaproteobacteria bacterium RBG_16_66_13]